MSPGCCSLGKPSLRVGQVSVLRLVIDDYDNRRLPALVPELFQPHLKQVLLLVLLPNCLDCLALILQRFGDLMLYHLGVRLVKSKCRANDTYEGLILVTHVVNDHGYQCRLPTFR